MYKCIVHMRPTRVQAMTFPLFCLCVCVCFHVVVCNMGMSVCCGVCMALTVQEHRVTHQFTLCCLASSQFVISG